MAIFNRLTTALDGAGAALGKVAESAKASAVGVSESVSAAVVSKKEAATEIFDRHWPTMERLLVDGLLDVAEDRLGDDQFVDDLLRRLYAPVPLPIRLLITEDYFVKKCGEKKPDLLALVVEKRRERSGLPLLDGSSG